MWGNGRGKRTMNFVLKQSKINVSRVANMVCRILGWSKDCNKDLLKRRDVEQRHKKPHNRVCEDYLEKLHK